MNRVAVTLVMGSMVSACSGGGLPPSDELDTPNDPGPVVQTGGHLMIELGPLVPFVVYSTPWLVEGGVGMEPLACGDPSLNPTVTWENVTTGEAGAANVREEWSWIPGTCAPYSFWVYIPLSTFGAQTIRFRGFYHDGRQFDEEVREVLRLHPDDPLPWFQ